MGQMSSNLTGPAASSPQSRRHAAGHVDTMDSRLPMTPPPYLRCAPATSTVACEARCQPSNFWLRSHVAHQVDRGPSTMSPCHLSVTSTGQTRAARWYRNLAGADAAMAPGYPAHRGREPIPWRCERGSQPGDAAVASDRCGATSRRSGERGRARQSRHSRAVDRQKYELTMLAAAHCATAAPIAPPFEVFASPTPTGRRYGLSPEPAGCWKRAAGSTLTTRASCWPIPRPATVRVSSRSGSAISAACRGCGPRVAGCSRYAAASPGCVLLETLVLSIFNHDTAIAAAAARMVARRMIEKPGSQRTHERAAAGTAYIAGFAASCSPARSDTAHGTAARIHLYQQAPCGRAGRIPAPRSKRWDPSAAGWIPSGNATGVANAVAAAGALSSARSHRSR